MTGLPSMSAALRNAVRILLPGLAPLAEGRVPKGRADADQRSEADIGTCLPAHPAAPTPAMHVLSVIP